MNWFSSSFLRTLLFIVIVLAFLFEVCVGDRVELKINLGGEAVDGFVAEQEVLDLDDSMAKMRYHGAIRGSGNDLNVFKTQRFTRGEDLVLNIPVPDGVYTVTLLFAETWKGAFSSGKRVFDVYMGSKPTGIVKVCPEMDPFRSGGPATPVRRTFPGVATQGGLTVALRPITQNPQIAGVIIDGYSYSNSLLEDLPTVPGTPGDQPDFSVLDRVTAQNPGDPSLLYDPSLNPKFKNEFKDSGAAIPPPSTSTSMMPPPAAPGTGSSSAYGLGGSQQLAPTPVSMGPSAPRTPSFGYSGVSGTNHATGGGQAVQPPPSVPISMAPGVAHTQAPANPPSQGFSPLSALSVRPTAYYRRRLASLNQQDGYEADPDLSARLEGLNSRVSQEQMDLSSARTPSKQSLDAYSARGQDGLRQSRPPSYTNSMPYPGVEVENSASTPGLRQTADYASTGFPQNTGPNPSLSPSTSFSPSLSNSHGDTQLTPTNAGRDAIPEQPPQYGSPMSSLSNEESKSQRIYQAQAQLETMQRAQVNGESTETERTSGQYADTSPSVADAMRTTPTWPSQTSPSMENSRQVGPGETPDSSAGAAPGVSQQYQMENSAPVSTQAIQSDRSTAMPSGAPSEVTSPMSGGAYNSRPSSEQPGYGMQMNEPAQPRYSPPTEGVPPNAMPLGGAEVAPPMNNPSSVGRGTSRPSPVGDYPSMKEPSQEEPMPSSLGRPPPMTRSVGDSPSGGASEGSSLGSTGALDAPGPPSYGGTGQDMSRMGAGLRQQEQGQLLNTVHRTALEDPMYAKQRERFAGNQGYGGNVNGIGDGMGHGVRSGAGAGMGNGVGSGMGNGIGSGIGNAMGNRQEGVRGRAQPLQEAGGGSGIPGMVGLPDLGGMVEGEGEGGGDSSRVPTAGVHNGMNGLDGMCIDNSTHCSCGMAERSGPVAEECLFVVNEKTDPMICARRACSGRLVCACAAGANLLCKRSNVRSILVSAQVHRHDMMEEPNVVFCRREQVEQGVGVLTPII